MLLNLTGTKTEYATVTLKPNAFVPVRRDNNGQQQLTTANNEKNNHNKCAEAQRKGQAKPRRFMCVLAAL